MLFHLFFLPFFLTYILPYLYFPLRIDLLRFHAGCCKRRPNLAFVISFYFVVHFDWWMRASVVLGLVFSIPGQEIGFGKRLRVVRRKATLNQSINQLPVLFSYWDSIESAATVHTWRVYCCCLLSWVWNCYVVIDQNGHILFISASGSWWQTAWTSPLWEPLHEGGEPEHWYDADVWLLLLKNFMMIMMTADFVCCWPYIGLLQCILYCLVL